MTGWLGNPNGWIHNTTTPYAEYRRCHCHGWRFDECPNTAVADWARAATKKESN